MKKIVERSRKLQEDKKVADQKAKEAAEAREKIR